MSWLSAQEPLPRQRKEYNVKHDVQATAEARFIDPRSYISPDGRQVLYDEDWVARKRLLWLRAEGRCEHVMTEQGPEGTATLRCGADGDDAHHIIPRHPKRDDSLKNLQLLCRYHHDLLDKRKVRSDRASRRADEANNSQGK